MNPGLIGNGPGVAGTSASTANLFKSGFYAKDTIVLSPVSYHFYIKLENSFDTVDPSADAVKWRRLGAGGIKSVAVYNDAITAGNATKSTTITEVSDKAIVLHNGDNSSFTYAIGDGTGCYVQKTSSTQVTAARATVNGVCVYAFTVIDYW